MLLSKTVTTKWVNKYKKYYENKGYIFTGNNTIFEVKVEDLLLNSNEYVEVLCDYCNTNISRKTYQAYNQGREIIQKDCCDECSHIKIQEIKKITMTEEKINNFKKKIGDKNRKYNNDDLMFELNKKNYSLIEAYKFKNVLEEFPYTCNIHPEFGVQHTSYSKLVKNEHCCQKCISTESSLRLRKYDENELTELFRKQECEWISGKYDNNLSKLEFICNHHIDKGNQTTTVSYMENNNGICLYCRDKASIKFPTQYVKDELLKKDLELLNEYDGYDSKLEFVCNLHKDLGIQECTYQQFKYNKFICSGCEADYKEKKRKEIESEFFDKMRQEGLIPTKNARYDDRDSKIEYICVHHLNIVQTISRQKFDLGRRCRQCGIDKNSGNTHYNYQGGISALNNHLRGLLRPLIDDKLKEYNYKCFITGKNGTLEVHHLYNFNKIVKDTLKELCLDVREKVEDYNQDEINNITNMFLHKHNGEWGVPILPELHDLFHKLYGRKNNNKKQFGEFIKDYNNCLV